MPFSNEIAAALFIIREALRSPNYVPGVSGWSINRDGSAEFSGALIRGDFQAGDDSGVKVIIDDQGMRIFNLGVLLFEIALNGPFVQALWYTLLGDPLITINGAGLIETPGITSSFTVDNVSSVPSISIGPSPAFPADNPVKLFNTSLAIPGGKVASAYSTAATVAVGAVVTKDAGCGDLAFTTYDTRTYQVRYSARCQASVAGTTMDIQLRDGGAASPTAASPLIGAKSIHLAGAAGAGATELSCVWDFDFNGTGFTAGDHTLAVFYVRTAGGGNVNVAQSTGGQREFVVYDTG